MIPQCYTDELEDYINKPTFMDVLLYDDLLFQKFVNQREIREQFQTYLMDVKKFKNQLQLEYEKGKYLDSNTDLIIRIQNFGQQFISKYNQTSTEFKEILLRKRDFNLLINTDKIKLLLKNANLIHQLFFSDDDLLNILKEQEDPYRFWLDILNKGLQYPKIGEIKIDYEIAKTLYQDQYQQIKSINLRFSDNYILDSLALAQGQVEDAINMLYEILDQ